MVESGSSKASVIAYLPSKSDDTVSAGEAGGLLRVNEPKDDDDVEVDLCEVLGGGAAGGSERAILERLSVSVVRMYTA